MENTIYVVTSHVCEGIDYDIEKAFSSKEEAQKFADDFIQWEKNVECGRYCKVEPIEFN